MSRYPSQSGFALVALLITIFFIATASIVTAQLTLSNLQVANAEYHRISAQFAADAGLDNAIHSLNTDGNWTGSGGEVTLYTSSNLKTTYQTTVTDDPSDDYKKYLTVTAKTYVPASSTTPKVQRKFEVELRGVGGGGSFSVVTGVGGLYMSNSAKIVGGDVYVNGEINLSNTAQIGLTTNTVDVKAAHANCPSPANATYPRVCANGENGQPIVLSGSSRIYGEVQATNQTNGAGMASPGLVAGSPAPAALPSHDRAGQIAAVASTVNASAVNCSSGTRTLTANLRINGNVSISGSCRVTVQGDVWITGNLTLSNTAEMIVQNGLTTQPNVMIDGSSGLRLSNSSILRSNTNATPIGFRMITYWSSASCSPSCADVTGTDLYNSRNTTTIQLSNSSSGPQTEFYARWSRVAINNSGNVGALVGQTIQISNSGTITFGTSISGVGGISAWVVESYKRTY
jgi:hypothetical protein